MIKYNQIMENITVTPALRARVLDALRTAQKKRRPPIYQIAGALAACLVLLVGAYFAQRYFTAPDAVTPPPVTVPGGVVEYATLAELAASLDFPLQVPHALPDGYVFDRAVNQFGMAVVFYQNGDAQLKFYMSRGSAAKDGYYPSDAGVSIPGATLYENGAAAVWERGEYSFSCFADAPLSAEAWRVLIESVE